MTLVMLALVGILGTWAVLLPAKWWEGKTEDHWPRRFLMLLLGAGVGLVAGVLDDALWIDWPATPRNFPFAERALGRGHGQFAADGQPTMLGYVAYFAMLFFAVRWWRLADPQRHGRITFGGLAMPAAVALLLPAVWQFPQPWGLIWAVMIAFCVQLVSSWQPELARPVEG